MSAQVESKLDQLEEITKNMDIPAFRRRKVRWLSRNMGIRNSDHPQFAEAQALVKELIKQGVQ